MDESVVALVEYLDPSHLEGIVAAKAVCACSPYAFCMAVASPIIEHNPIHSGFLTQTQAELFNLSITNHLNTTDLLARYKAHQIVILTQRI
jgi:hypothetical protein